MLVAIDLALAARCKRCSTLTPVGGVRDEVPCLACTHPVDVRAGMPDLFDANDILLAALVSDAGAELYADRGDAIAVAQSVAAACRSCRAALALPAEGTAALACSCGTHVAVRWPDAQTRGWDLRLRCVLGESEPVAPKLTPSGIVVPCGGCGAPLSGPIHGRSITCDHCDTSNVLPDAVFMRLVPDAPPQPFMLVYDVDDAMLAQTLARTDPDDRRWRHNKRYAELQKRAHAMRLERALRGEDPISFDVARDLAARDLTAEEAKHVDNRLSNAERQKLVGGRVAQTLIDRWAASPDGGTRVVAARVANPERFADDPDANVRAVVAGRKHVPDDLIEKLAKDSASHVRAAVAARKDCPVEILKKLGHDGDAKVAEAARANPSYPRGLFERLFDS